MMQFMDKLALSQATMFNLREDLVCCFSLHSIDSARETEINYRKNLQGQDYSWASSIFYFGYLAWSPISSYLAVRLPLGKYLTVMVFVCVASTIFSPFTNLTQAYLGRCFDVPRRG